MFVLNCPSCGHRTRVKFARMGAVATCVGCKQKFKVDTGSLIVIEDDAPEAAGVAPSPTPGTPGTSAAPAAPAAPVNVASDPAAPPASFAPQPQPDPPAPASSAASGAPRPAAPAPRQPRTAPRHAPAPTPDLPAPPAPDHADHVPDFIPASAYANTGRASAASMRRSRGVNPAFVGLFVVLAIGLGGLLAFLLVNEESTKTHASTHTANAPATTDHPNPPTHVATKPPEPPPVHHHPAPASQVAMDESPTVNWVAIPPTDPIQPQPFAGAVAWNTWLTRSPDGKRAMIQGVLVTDGSRVYRTVDVHVQLLDAQRQAYAEIDQTIPLPATQTGLHLRLPIPAEMMESYTGYVAQVAPGAVARHAAAVQMVDSRTNLEGAEGGPIQLAFRNPASEPMTQTRLAVELLDADGWPLGTWLAKLDVTVGPNAVAAFRFSPHLPPGVRPWRVVLRGYGKLGP